jgi:FkbM family methyltransferase
MLKDLILDLKPQGCTVRSHLKRIVNKLKLKLLRISPRNKNHQLNDQKRFTYSQCGEDVIVEYIFRLKGISQISYLDIGAFDPFYLSNTALFYVLGSSGLVIDPSPGIELKFKRLRPRDAVLPIAVALSDETLKYYEFSDQTLNTTSEQEMKDLLKAGKHLIRTSSVQAMRINDIIRKNFHGICPDFLSIDIEGMDLKILKTLDFDSYRPKVICMETVKYSPVGRGEKISDAISFLTTHGYQEYAFTGLNSLFVDFAFWQG